jgi:hypothetical protein
MLRSWPLFDDIRRIYLGYYTLPDTSRWPREKVAVCAYPIRYQGRLLLFDIGVGVGHAAEEREFGPIICRDLRVELAAAGVQVRDISR